MEVELNIPRPTEFINRGDYQLEPKVVKVDGRPYLVQRTDRNPKPQVFGFNGYIDHNRASVTTIDADEQDRLRSVLGNVDCFNLGDRDYTDVERDGVIRYIDEFTQRNRDGATFESIRQEIGVSASKMKEIIEDLESEKRIENHKTYHVVEGKKRATTRYRPNPGYIILPEPSEIKELMEGYSF